MGLLAAHSFSAGSTTLDPLVLTVSSLWFTAQITAGRVQMTKHWDCLPLASKYQPHSLHPRQQYSLIKPKYDTSVYVGYNVMS
ncbi:hypothetical protein DL93DRAFT_2071300 [Clavulina sp. PMI_390]|nr:hypothetical protein DL93DRAFT_2071300 [Clavulina sp. PMI_390]